MQFDRSSYGGIVPPSRFLLERFLLLEPARTPAGNVELRPVRERLRRPVPSVVLTSAEAAAYSAALRSPAADSAQAVYGTAASPAAVGVAVAPEHLGRGTVVLRFGERASRGWSETARVVLFEDEAHALAAAITALATPAAAPARVSMVAISATVAVTVGELPCTATLSLIDDGEQLLVEIPDHPLSASVRPLADVLELLRGGQQPLQLDDVVVPDLGDLVEALVDLGALDPITGESAPLGDVALTAETITLQLTAEQTAAWARAERPASPLAGRALRLHFDAGGIVDAENLDLPAARDVLVDLHALVAAALGDRVPRSHPAYDGAVGNHLTDRDGAGEGER